MASTNHPPHPCPGASAEVRADAGAWLSGPGVITEPVHAALIKPGDRILHDGRVATVTMTAWPVPYREHGEYREGCEIDARAPGADGPVLYCLFRQPAETLDRIVP